MKVTLQHFTLVSYARIQTGTRDVAVMIDDPDAPAESLRNLAKDLRAQADRLHTNARLYEEAATYLEAP